MRLMRWLDMARLKPQEFLLLLGTQCTSTGGAPGAVAAAPALLPPDAAQAPGRLCLAARREEHKVAGG